MENILFNFDTERKWDYENGFYLTSHKTRISKLLAHYELYKMILNLPGQVVECGVYKGASLIRMASFRDSLESSYSRKIIGFDIFGKFPKSGNTNDLKFIERFEKAGGDGISKEELEEILNYKEFTNYELVKGDITETIPDYLKLHPELRISLLHIDVDIYKPSKFALEQLYNRVVTGGLIVLDDYSTVAGETDAVDEFFKNKKIQKLSMLHIPSYIVK